MHPRVLSLPQKRTTKHKPEVFLDQFLRQSFPEAEFQLTEAKLKQILPLENWQSRYFLSHLKFKVQEKAVCEEISK